LNPSSSPSGKPSDVPSLVPSLNPSLSPSGKPSDVPSLVPSLNPSLSPSGKPSDVPSLVPSSDPSAEPSGLPSRSPSSVPSAVPSRLPSLNPSSSPSVKPSDFPSLYPSPLPSGFPSQAISVVPSVSPSCNTVNPFKTVSSICKIDDEVVQSKILSPNLIVINTQNLTNVDFSITRHLPDQENVGIQLDDIYLLTKFYMLGNKASSQFEAQCIRGVTGVTIIISPKTGIELDDFEACDAGAITGTFCAYRVEIPCEPIDGCTSKEDDSVEPSTLSSKSPASVPFVASSAVPSLDPSSFPSFEPSDVPSLVPSSNPSAEPFGIPSRSASSIPSLVPSRLPSVDSSTSPSGEPSDIPSGVPSSDPSSELSAISSRNPTGDPSDEPSVFLSIAPSSLPSFSPGCNTVNAPKILSSVCKVGSEVIDDRILPSTAIKINSQNFVNVDFSISQQDFFQDRVAIKFNNIDLDSKCDILVDRDSYDFKSQCFQGMTGVTILVYPKPIIELEQCQACDVNALDGTFCAYRVEIPCEPMNDCMSIFPSNLPSDVPSSSPIDSPSDVPGSSPINSQSTTDLDCDSLKNFGFGFSEATGNPHYTKTCYPHITILSPNNLPGRDDSVAVFAGGNFSGVNSAEVEGKVVVLGNLEVKSGGPGNFVSVGVGSHVIPNSGTDCIVVGGNLKADRDVQVFNQVSSMSCDIVYKGSSSTTGRWKTQGLVRNDPTYDLTHYQQMRAVLLKKSKYWKTLPANGNVSYKYSTTTYTCTDEPDEIQVFNIDAENSDELESITKATSYTFTSNCEDKTILINVQGTGDVAVFAAAMSDFDSKMGFLEGGFSTCMTQNILWNFPDFTNVDIGAGGTSEFHGSLLVSGNLLLSTSGHSGRAMVVGNIIHDSSSGSEFHSYPYNPPTPLPDPDDICVLADGWETSVPDYPTLPPIPTRSPINSPSDVPSSSPINTPSDVPSENPIAKPTEAPINLPAPVCEGIWKNKNHQVDTAKCRQCLTGKKNWPCNDKSNCTAGCFLPPPTLPPGCNAIPIALLTNAGATSDEKCRKCPGGYKNYPCNKKKPRICTPECYILSNADS